MLFIKMLSIHFLGECIKESKKKILTQYYNIYLSVFDNKKVNHLQSAMWYMAKSKDEHCVNKCKLYLFA